MTQAATKQQPEMAAEPILEDYSLDEVTVEDSHARQVQRLRLLWQSQRVLLRGAAVGLLASTLIAFMIPKSFTATTQLMPPDPLGNTGMAMMAAMAGKTGGGLGAVTGDLLGLKSSGALLIGVLRSQTSQERLIRQFDLQKVYGKRLVTDARTKLDENTAISEDRKSGIITISVKDHDAQRSAALASAYVDQLNSLVSQLSTSSAHRERVFLEERLKVAKLELDTAEDQFAEFSSKNNTLDIQLEGKAMLDQAGALAGEMIATQSQLEGLRQIYTDNNSRVRALRARVGELRKQLERLGGAPEKRAGASTASVEKLGRTAAEQESGMPYPTIRSLPLLGARYADYYRRAKIQETVYELLTEQYEMAKVQEAKETPSVKILDPARIPERRSFPPRIQIVFLGTMFAFALCVAWVMGTARWDEVDAQDPRKVFAQEVAATLRARVQWGRRNGNSPEPPVKEISDEFGGQRRDAIGPFDR